MPACLCAGADVQLYISCGSGKMYLQMFLVIYQLSFGFSADDRNWTHYRD